MPAITAVRRRQQAPVVAEQPDVAEAATTQPLSERISCQATVRST